MRKIITGFLFIFLCSLPLLAQSSAKHSTTSVSQISTDSVQISIVDNVVYLENAPVGSKMEVFSILGVKVQEVVIRMPRIEYRLSLPKGYYIVRIEDRVKKIIVR